MKKLVSLFLLLICVCSVMLCGCTKDKSATFNSIVELYNSIAKEYDNDNIFTGGNVDENGAHIKITYENQNLNNCISQVNIASYSGDDLTKYKRFALLSTLTTSTGDYDVLFNSLWVQFYFCCDRDILSNIQLNNIVPQEIRTNLYNYLSEIKSAINEIISSRRTLESVTSGSTFNPVSAPAQNSLTNYFLKLNNLLTKSLKFNLEFEKAMNIENGELSLEDLPQTIKSGAIKIVLDRTPLCLSEYFIYKNVVANDGLDKLSTEQRAFFNNFKTYFAKIQNAVKRENVSKFSSFDNDAITTDANIAYTALRNREKDLLNALPTFVNSATSIKNANENQKAYYEINLTDFTNVALTYYNYSLSLLNLIVA